ncbi:hypothetical protein M9Y10_043139 [Tritrichomonas musculus]|uniref:Thioredoxin domain-containing protein n=1 Tax=Tritrichomonas musculus TaxID=1915356 RepID=A0ABR2JYU3_9EUKA
MLISFFLLCLSYFIPFDLKPTKLVDINSYGQLIRIKQFSKSCVVFIGDLNNPETEKYKDCFLRVSTFFGKKVSFLCIDSLYCSDLLTRYGQRPPCLVFYKNSSEWMVVPFPRKEESLLFLFDHFLSQKLVIANHEADVLSYLGHFDFALLTSPDLSNLTLTLRFQASLYLGNLDIVVCDKNLLSQYFQIKEGEIGIYRSEDRTIKSVQPTFDAIFEGSIPSFRRFVTTDFREPNSTFLAFLGVNQNDEQSLSSYSNDIDDLLYELSTQFPQFIIGYLEPKLHYIARHATLQNFKTLPTMISFSTHDRSYFPYEHGSLFQLPFSKDKWLNDAKFYLTQISKGKIKRKYHSEPVPKTNKSDPVEKIVGSTYDSFMNDKKHDLYVMFIKSNGGSCNDALEEFRKAAKIAKNIRFGVIDAYLNSSPREFPHIITLPYVRFYPSKNHSNSTPFLQLMNQNNFLRYAMKFGSQKYNFDVPQKSLSELRVEMNDFSKIVGRLPSEDRLKMEKYFKELIIETRAQAQASQNKEL